MLHRQQRNHSSWRVENNTPFIGRTTYNITIPFTQYDRDWAQFTCNVGLHNNSNPKILSQQGDHNYTSTNPIDGSTPTSQSTLPLNSKHLITKTKTYTIIMLVYNLLLVV